jgi:CubicO group peptidase (beta-lactamase class C family)
MCRTTTGREFDYSPSKAFWDHQPDGGSVMDHQISFPDYPSGRIYTSATDFARLILMFLNGGNLGGARILRQTSIDTMLTPSDLWNVDGWRQGLGVAGPKDLRGRQLWGHDGQERGYASAFYFNPETHVGVIAFSNGNYADFTKNYALVDLDSHLMSWFENSPNH